MLLKLIAIHPLLKLKINIKRKGDTIGHRTHDLLMVFNEPSEEGRKV